MEGEMSEGPMSVVSFSLDTIHSFSWVLLPASEEI